MNCDIDCLMEAIRDLAGASERVGGYSYAATRRVINADENLKQAYADVAEMWEKIEAMTGGKRP